MKLREQDAQHDHQQQSQDFAVGVPGGSEVECEGGHELWMNFLSKLHNGDRTMYPKNNHTPFLFLSLENESEITLAHVH